MPATIINASPAAQASSPSKHIVDIPKNSREIVRVELSNYKGIELIRLWVWYDAGNGELRPGKGGISLRAGKLPELYAAIGKALEAAKAEGLLESSR